MEDVEGLGRSRQELKVAWTQEVATEIREFPAPAGPGMVPRLEKAFPGTH